MTMETNFSDILDRRPSEIERPKPLPQGTYTTIIVGLPRFDKSAKKQTPFVEFQHKMLAAGEDVDQEALAEVLGDRSITEITMRNTFYLTDTAAWRLKEFLRDCGFDIADDSMSIREMIEQTAGKSVGVHITHVPSQDGAAIYAQIDRTAALE